MLFHSPPYSIDNTQIQTFIRAFRAPTSRVQLFYFLTPTKNQYSGRISIFDHGAKKILLSKSREKE